MSDEKKTPSMKSGSDGTDSKDNSSTDEKDKKNTSEGSSDDKGSESGSKNSSDKGSKSGDNKNSKGGTEAKADANEKSNGGSGGKSSGLAVGDAAGVMADKESKGGADTKANEEMSGKKGGILGGLGGGSGKKKSIPQRLASLGAKISMAAHAALTFFKTMILMQLLAMLQALLSAIAAAITSLVSTIMTVLTTIATTVATVLGVSVAAAAVVMVGGIVGIVAVVALVVVGVIVNNTAVKDDVVPCPEVDLDYMEVPDGIPTQAWTNAKLIYTFFKSYGNAVAEVTGDPNDGYTDEMIAGILGNWYTESQIDTTAVETVFDEPYAIGPKKMFLWQGGVDVTWTYHEESGSYTNASGEEVSYSYDVYDGTEIDPYYEFSTTVGFLGSPDDTVIIQDYFDSHGYGVAKDSPVNHEPIMFEVKWIQDLYEVSYWDSYPAIEYMGLGLGQWTNGRNTELLDYADEKNRQWYDIDLQLMYCLTEPAGSFFIDWQGERDIDSYESIEGTVYTDGMTYGGEVMDSAAEIASATEDFFVDWEAGGTGNAAASNSADVRIQNALMWFNIIKEWRDGVDYVLGTGSSLWNTLASASAIASDVTQSGKASDCNNLTFMGNASLAEAMVSFAWAPDKDDHNDGTQCWRHLHDTLAPGDKFKRSCDRTVCIGVWWSGTDSDYLLGDTTAQLDYLVKKSVQYELMLSAGTTAGMTDDTAWWHEVDMSSATTVDEFVALLKPGDVLIRNDEYEGNGGDVGHTLVYVGSETVLRRWPDSDPGYCIVHGSLNQRSPGTDKFGAGGGGANDYTTYRVFRNMKTYCATEYRSRVAVTCAGYSNEEQ